MMNLKRFTPKAHSKTPKIKAMNMLNADSQREGVKMSSSIKVKMKLSANFCPSTLCIL